MNLMEQACFFIGHRDTSSAVFCQLCQTVEQHIVVHGVTSFYVGHYGRFDSLAAEAVILAKTHHPEVKLYLLLPYHPYNCPITTPDGFDGTYYPPGMENVPNRFAIIRANQHMVKTCGYLIAYVSHPSGGSQKILEMALRRQARKEMHVCNLGGWRTG